MEITFKFQPGERVDAVAPSGARTGLYIERASYTICAAGGDRGWNSYLCVNEKFEQQWIDERYLSPASCVPQPTV